jgi:hypothetical protein
VRGYQMNYQDDFTEEYNHADFRTGLGLTIFIAVILIVTIMFAGNIYINIIGYGGLLIQFYNFNKFLEKDTIPPILFNFLMFIFFMIAVILFKDPYFRFFAVGGILLEITYLNRILHYID